MAMVLLHIGTSGEGVNHDAADSFTYRRQFGPARSRPAWSAPNRSATVRGHRGSVDRPGPDRRTTTRPLGTQLRHRHAPHRGAGPLEGATLRAFLCPADEGSGLLQQRLSFRHAVRLRRSDVEDPAVPGELVARARV